MWVNHVAIAAPRNGTNSHTVTPSSGSVVAGALFTPTAGRLLICVCEGAVTSGSDTSVPTAPPSGWTSGAQAVDQTGLYVWHKTAAGGDSVTVIHNGSNYPAVFDFYEFDAGTTWTDGVGQTGVSPDTDGPTLTGLTGANFVAYAAAQVVSATTTDQVYSWSVGTIATGTALPGDGSTEGYVYGLAYSDGFTDASAASAANINTGFLNQERLVWAVNSDAVVPPPTPFTGFVGTSAVIKAYLGTEVISAGAIAPPDPPPDGGDPDDPNVDLATYVYKDETNTGLAGVGLTEADLTTYTGSTTFTSGTTVIENKIINSDIVGRGSATVTFRKCKLNAKIDFDDLTTGSITLEDCDTDATGWNGSGIGFDHIFAYRCNIKGGKDGVALASGVVEDCYVHDQFISSDSGGHCQGVGNWGGGMGSTILRRSTISCTVPNNDAGGGATANLSLFENFGALSNITVEYCYFPVSTGGFSVTLGYGPPDGNGDNPTNIVFRHNILARDASGKGGAFGTVTCWGEDTGDGVHRVGNQYYDNVWKDTGEEVPVNA